jgi:hypothetical protein
LQQHPYHCQHTDAKGKCQQTVHPLIPVPHQIPYQHLIRIFSYMIFRRYTIIYFLISTKSILWNLNQSSL